MKTRDKAFVVALIVFLIFSAIYILHETPIQKQARELHGDLTVYEYQ